MGRDCNHWSVGQSAIHDPEAWPLRSPPLRSVILSLAYRLLGGCCDAGVEDSRPQLKTHSVILEDTGSLKDCVFHWPMSGVRNRSTPRSG